MNCRISLLIIGDEILSGKTRDVNAYTIAGSLKKNGFSIQRMVVSSDEKSELVSNIRSLLQVSDVVIMSGGLGPTSDDITRFGFAEAVEEELAFFEDEFETIKAKFKSRSLDICQLSRIEAMLPAGSKPLRNSVGIAPGIHYNKDGKSVFSIPGVPDEARAMFTEEILPFIKNEYDSENTIEKVFKTIGVGESVLYNKIKDFLPESVSAGYYPSGREVELRLKSESASDLEQVSERIRDALGENIYAEDDVSLLDVIIKKMSERGERLAFAESCTGGLLAKRITDVAGSSSVFAGAAVVYSNKAKVAVLGVSEDVLEANGAVSSPVVRQMAEGAARVYGADITVSLSGIAGPGGGSEEKPVGTVFCGIYNKGKVSDVKLNLRGGRDRVRWLASQYALFEIWKAIK